MRDGNLVFDASADGVAVVAAEENHGAVQHGGEIHRSVEVALRRRPFSEIDDGDVALLCILEGVCAAVGLRQLRRQRRRDRLEIQCLFLCRPSM